MYRRYGRKAPRATEQAPVAAVRISGRPVRLPEPLWQDCAMEPEPIVVPPGEGHRVGNVEFLARTADTPRFTFGIIEIAPGRVLEPHVHREEDDAFYIVEGEMTFVFGDREVPAPPGTFVLAPPGVEHAFRNDGSVPVRMLNIHAPAGFDRRIGLAD
jgi:mannose-6-phosphate isomerase-like protein (cupin superfamily)